MTAAGSGWTGCCSRQPGIRSTTWLHPWHAGGRWGPLGAIVLLGDPTFPRCVITARPVGVFWMRDEHGPDAKILTVPARDPRYSALHDLADVPVHLRDEISHVFDIYKELEPGKATDIRGWQDRAAAEQAIAEATERGAAKDRSSSKRPARCWSSSRLALVKVPRGHENGEWR